MSIHLGEVAVNNEQKEVAQPIEVFEEKEVVELVNQISGAVIQAAAEGVKVAAKAAAGPSSARIINPSVDGSARIVHRAARPAIEGSGGSSSRCLNGLPGWLAWLIR